MTGEFQGQASRFPIRITGYIKCKEQSIYTPQDWILTVLVTHDRAETLTDLSPLPRKATIVQLLKKPAAFYRIRMFIQIFTTARR